MDGAGAHHIHMHRRAGTNLQVKGSRRLGLADILTGSDFIQGYHHDTSLASHLSPCFCYRVARSERGTNRRGSTIRHCSASKSISWSPRRRFRKLTCWARRGVGVFVGMLGIGLVVSFGACRFALCKGEGLLEGRTEVGLTLEVLARGS